MLRIKFVAVLIGPSGIGLMGVYNSIIGVVSSVAGMGLSSSGVRQIAAAHGAGDQDQVARAVKTLRRTVWFTGSIGMGCMILGSGYISQASFGTKSYASSIALLGITVLLANVATGQSCVLQGTRRIIDLAKVSVVGALSGTALSIPCLYFFGLRGIVPGIILTALAGLATSWWFARQVTIKPVPMSWHASKHEASKLLRLGVPLMFSGLMGTLSAYLINSLLIRQLGLEAMGIWQAALSLSGVIANFVLNAMGTDYYPRLAAIEADDQRVCEQVNAQTEISLLLAVPCLAATIIFAPMAINLFYSGKFEAAVDILRWAVYGIYGRVISYPLGYVILAKGKGKTFFCVESFHNAFYVVAVLYCTRLWGLPGAGIAFCSLYVIVTLVNYTVANAISRTRWTWSNITLIMTFGSLLALIGLNCAFVGTFWIQFLLNILILVGLSGYCIHRLLRKSGITFQSLCLRWRPPSS